jgi:hypothetical protein
MGELRPPDLAQHMNITFLQDVARSPLPFRTAVPAEIEQIRQWIRDDLVMGYISFQDPEETSEFGTVLSVTPDGRAFMALHKIELDRSRDLSS